MLIFFRLSNFVLKFTIMSKEWLIKISVNDYLFGYIEGSTALELMGDIKSFLKDHPEGKVQILFNFRILINCC